MGNVWCDFFSLHELRLIPDPIFLFLSRSVGRDPTYFPDPELFNPQRWLTKEGKFKEELKSYPFGFGRRCLVFSFVFFLAISSHYSCRVCPGQYLATA